VRRSFFALFVVAVASLGAWPAFVSLRSGQAAADALPSMAPVTADYRYRDKLVAFWEGAVRQNARNDMLSPRVLADQYLQRYRETGDIDDVLRAAHGRAVSAGAARRQRAGRSSHGGHAAHLTSFSGSAFFRPRSREVSPGRPEPHDARGVAR